MLRVTGCEFYDEAQQVCRQVEIAILPVVLPASMTVADIVSVLVVDRGVAALELVSVQHHVQSVWVERAVGFEVVSPRAARGILTQLASPDAMALAILVLFIALY